MAKVTAENFGDELQRILLKYCDEVSEATAEGVKAATKAGVQAVKSGAAEKFDGTGKYAAGWTSQVETGRFSAQGVIYNAKVPGLPHLLEYGHAKRGGGRVPGRVHIATVEEAIAAAFMKSFEAKL